MRMTRQSPDVEGRGKIPKARLCVWFAALALALGPTATVTAQPQTGPQDVSLIRLIANPNDFDGKPVRVIAFLRLEFEGNALYVSRADYENHISKNGIWIDVPDLVRKEASEYSDRYVLVEGVFSAKDQGHMHLFSGALHKTSRLEVWNLRGNRKMWPPLKEKQ
ncbi:MAG TPA: hypothetical protein VFG04_20670 [Planctomycetaceae bacterium]|jgi:hypothetical protein|nr:hypothetical protein [Planctomycetaceae bacterium]